MKMLEKWPSSQGKMVTSAITSEVWEKGKRDEEGNWILFRLKTLTWVSV